MLSLYTYYRSSAAFRVRIALELKGLAHASIPIHLLQDGGRQHGPEYAGRNPAQLIPALDVDGATLTQSLAIMEYLEEAHPRPALLPAAALDRARVRAIALSIACEIHPLNNLRVLRYLGSALGIDEDRRNAWYRHWIETGFAALEQLLARDRPAGAFCHGESPTIADCCLVPQVFNARRFKIPLEAFPNILAVHDACMALGAFRRAAPEAQADAE
ncbi:MAG TPA: maleylacetoacetate isomerase [Steroidobacteraceae bacterium]|nr:maleylacetoacetate isomerase [Steroidobacteraceae bacterium]